MFDETSDEEVDSSDEESLWSNENYETNLVDEKRGNNVSGEILLSILVNGTRKNVVALLDSRTSQSLFNRSLTDKNMTIKSKKTVKWETKAGEFCTMGRALVKACKMPQFTSQRKFDRVFHLFEKHESDRYDVILGRDLMKNLGIDLLYSTGTIKWGEIHVPMVPTGHFSANGSKMKLFKSES